MLLFSVIYVRGASKRTNAKSNSYFGEKFKGGTKDCLSKPKSSTRPQS